MPDNGSIQTEEDLALALAEKAKPDAAKYSIQGRAEAAETLQPLVWYISASADEIPAYWSAARDVSLRKFWKTESILAGAIYSQVAKIKTLGWTLDGPQRQVNRYQRMLSEAEFGNGWGVLISKVVEDYLCQDRGAFVEVIRASKDATGPVIGLAHLDASRCMPTGDLEYPVVYANARTGRPHKLADAQVIHLPSLPSPDESLKNIGFCAVSRVLRASQILRDIVTYKREKLSSRPQRGIVFVQGMSQHRLNAAFAEAQEQMDNEGLTRFAKVVTIASQDPGQPLDIKSFDFASLPDGYDEQTTTTLYAYIVALACGTDAREFWPATASGATKADAQVQAQKARGKGSGDILTSIERAINWKVLPDSLTFRFDFQDDEEDAQKAALEGARIGNIVKMYFPGAGVEGLVSKAEARQLLADQQILPPEFLANEPDVTPNVIADDVEQEEAPEPTEPVAAEAPATDETPVEES